MKRTFKTILLGAAIALTLAACSDDAKIASKNLSKAADMFEINRRVVFYDSIQGKYILSIEGLCSITKDNADKQLEVTCKTGPDSYKKHFLGIADNVTYFAEQIDPAKASAFHYRVIFKPESLINNYDLSLSGSKQ